MKNYNQSPLPFQGQKRRFLNEFKKALKEVPEGVVFVDLFGGSGLLSHTVKSERPDATVIYNDFDNFAQRIAAIPETNKLLAEIRKLTKNCDKKKRIDNKIKASVLALLRTQIGFVDYITLSASLLFSGKYANNFEELEKETWYCCVKQSDYNADGYLQGVERVSEDYKKVFEQYKSNKDIVFLIDPPYLSTDAKSYKSYWKLRDYLDVLDTLQPGNFFYFTSNKSQLLELCQWFETRTAYTSPFSGSCMVSVAGSVNFNAQYEDIMLYKIKQNE